ncbi:Uncharacterized protein APZ42_031720 [Daphnia magna]|uniref:Uncharacterized protein n=1 Tax=Daphnia magna TaxID=35525 RepID=A0A164MK87_9CRUS|nr:Uncharacterized protein APZ42_031720 [Daphnia magna]
MFPLYKCEQTYFLPTVYVCAERTFYYFIFKGNSWQPSRWGGVVFKMKNVNEKKKESTRPLCFIPVDRNRKKKKIY